MIFNDYISNDSLILFSHMFGSELNSLFLAKKKQRKTEGSPEYSRIKHYIKKNRLKKLE